MRTLPAIAIAALSAAALAGTAAAADHNSHVISVPLPDGATARVEYVGDIAPRVTIEPASSADNDDWAPLPSFAGFDRMIAQMDREREAMMRQAQTMASSAPAVDAVPFVASFGNSPAGITSTTMVSYSNASGTCTRTTEAVSQGPGKAPKIRSSISGQCGTSAESNRSAAPVNRT